jgi:hypothetical protein
VLTYAASLSAVGADPTVVTVPDPTTVSPGFLGFAVMFLLAVATILLIRSMVGHLRKVRYMAEPGDESQVPPRTSGASSNSEAPRNSGSA